MHQRSSVDEERSLPTSSDVTHQCNVKVRRHGDYSSVVEHSTANREVPGINQGVSLFREFSVGAFDCRSRGPWFKPGCPLLQGSEEKYCLRVSKAAMICPVLYIS
ncbi:hypothetical protein TNCV_4292321 [Trichonephila clavipes]|uniref:Uncharacterized protein n=1 Tax=Trichonephila clavipes TaxID=2585209 RepID=A0A8X6V3Y6_TRICX|nr:hypothetical protein TNCV_4292321 [Trichonephila clavipes]